MVRPGRVYFGLFRFGEYSLKLGWAASIGIFMVVGLERISVYRYCLSWGQGSPNLVYCGSDCVGFICVEASLGFAMAVGMQGHCLSLLVVVGPGGAYFGLFRFCGAFVSVELGVLY